MMRNKWIWLVLVAVIATTVALAGEHGKCTMSTQDCLDKMAARMKTSGWVGLELDPDKATGAYAVVKVIPGSPAEGAGIHAGDVLLALNGIRFSEENEEALMKAKKESKPGQSVTYTIKRDGAERQVRLTLGAMPADLVAAYIGQHMLEHAKVEIAQTPKAPQK